ncbi:MAG: TIGR00159 family protein [Acidobacteria bacterium]|nr:TIGR00159 family protein [Acidobacteriota bacterium]
MAEFVLQFGSFFKSIGWKDLLDIGLVAFLVYEVLRLVRGTRAVQMAAGLIAIALLYQLSRWFGLDTVEWVLRNAVVYLGFGIIVLFQRELRAALLHFGKNFRAPFDQLRRRAKAHEHSWYDDVVQAAMDLSMDKVGALIIIERDVGLKTYIESGIRMDARLTYDLLVTIFNTNTPLHDGAAIISNNRVAAASCFLPLTQDPRISRELGTRHRAAIGITEDTDACAVVVSEETGQVSFAIGGRMTRNLDGPRLRRLILHAIEPWHTDEEADAHEAEERRREMELQEILTTRQSQAKQTQSERGESYNDGLTEEVQS